MNKKIKDLPKDTLICIVENIQRELKKEKALTKMKIKERPINTFNLEYYWIDVNVSVGEHGN